MQYFTNSELADKYHVSVRTVRGWITRAKQGKLDLTLHVEKGTTYVANTAGNIATIEWYVELGKSRRNRKAYKTLTPKKEFYSLYTQAQIYDIVRNLEIHREIPRDYNYFDGGANNWNEYALRMANEAAPNNLTMTLKLLAELVLQL